MSEATFLEATRYVITNPLLRDLLIGVASNAAYDALKKIMTCLCDRFKRRPDVFETPKVEDMKSRLESELEKFKEGRRSPITQSSIERFQQFLFPNREITLDQLNDSQCDYIAERMFYGVTFQYMLTEIDFDENDVKYLFAFPSGYPREPYYFDIKAKRNTPYIDIMLVASIVDDRAFNPLDAAQAIPERIKEINKNNPRSSFRDFDHYVVIHTGNVNPELGMRLRETLVHFQRTYSALPRFIYFKKDELDDIMRLPQKERGVQLNNIFLNLKIDRGI